MKQIINKNKQFIKTQNLYQKTPVTKLFFKMMFAGFWISLFLVLFVFVDQLMILYLIPLTNHYQFQSLFLIKNDVFKNILVNYNGIKNQIVIQSIANLFNLEFFSSSDVISSSITLTNALVLIIQVFPTFVFVSSVFYVKAVAKQDFSYAIDIYKNTFITALFSCLIGMILLFILIPTIIPLQVKQHNLSWEQLINLKQDLINKLNQANLGQNFLKNNLVSIFYDKNNFFIQVKTNNHFYLISLHQNIFNLSIFDLKTFINLKNFSFSLNNLLNTWNMYFDSIRTYSINWAEQFYIF